MLLATDSKAFILKLVMLVKLAFAMQKLKKNVLKSFGHDQERWGGGCNYEGDIELTGGVPH